LLLKSKTKQQPSALLKNKALLELQALKRKERTGKSFLPGKKTRWQTNEIMGDIMGWENCLLPNRCIPAGLLLWRNGNNSRILYHEIVPAEFQLPSQKTGK